MFTEVIPSLQYANSLTDYSRRKTIAVNIGGLPMGSDYPIRIQSMTTIDTMDTEGSIAQTIRMVESGCEYVRITAPSVKEAQNLENIKKGLRARGYDVPLIADIHFTPNAAELAARIVEKVRINPGNYADKKRFETIEYTDASYQQELERIREKFVPLVQICKEYGTAMRIGTNHGSLSDRIMSRYGDSPVGMVESALEFLRICEEFNYYNVVLSMKSSNPLVMVEAYRLLVNRLDEEGLKPYPLHLGVTEAGEGEDGRVKSAVGIGTLLEDGLGDTVRVSLTEDPEFEAPVAKALVARYAQRKAQPAIKPVQELPINPFQYSRRKTHEVYNLGASNVPRVIADLSEVSIEKYEDLRSVGHFYLPAPDKWKMNDQGVDFIYTGSKPVPFMLPMGVKEIIDYKTWLALDDKNNKFPLFNPLEYHLGFSNDAPHSNQLNFLRLNLAQLNPEMIAVLRQTTQTVLVVHTNNPHAMPELRRLFFTLLENNVHCPVVVQRQYATADAEHLALYAATDCGGLLVDGLGDGIMLSVQNAPDSPNAERLKMAATQNSVGFGILQAARTRMSKTEYISCPSCGRTLFDLQETTALIRKRTDHLKGVKIGIMGCIVNGPGEMADADYGYVGIGKDKIALYRGQQVIKKSVAASQAVDELLVLIKEDGRWNEPETIEI
ncbi:MAG: 4-hydroxy-3-methylbut-2-en-1-yl diphosphate synthase [Runella slithyformis]|nr:MAG: 4-hydroxy-3-methylbut-2-en-1-yl diphosphate synthase [Runella slithyformis]